MCIAGIAFYVNLIDRTTETHLLKASSPLQL